MRKRDVRVVVCGDESTGKSSIITSLLKESFVPLPPQTILPEVTVPAEGPERGLTTYIVDTSPRREDRPHLEQELRKAQVVALVYSIDDPQSFDRLAEHWLPMIRQLGVNVPVVLVGNKIDLRGGSDVSNEALEEEILPIMSEYKEVETCVECSAKACLNIAEVFYFAQRAVLYPTAPLYDSREHILKAACLHALQRIFRLCDADKDDVLNDVELNAFQRKCFKAPLQQSELDGIKDVVRQQDPAFVVNGGITEAGFVHLQVLFIQQGRLETCWIMLRAFGYGEDLSLKQSFLEPRFDVPSDCSVELSPSGYAFFTDLFERHDKDRDGALRTTELDALFATSPGNPWLAQGFPETTVTDDFGAVTLQGWLAQWSMTTLLDHRTTLAYLAYLGYGSSESGTTSALTLGPARRSSQGWSARTASSKGVRERNVLCAFVLGAAGSGKTTLLNRFVGKPARHGDAATTAYEPTGRTKEAVNSVEIRGGAEKYLVLLEFGRYEAEALRSAKRLAAADLIVYVYDSADTNSFTHVSNLRQQYKLLDAVPCLFVATKSDLDKAQQRHEVQPEEYARRLMLRAPTSVNWNADLADLFRNIAEAALAPSMHGAIPGGGVARRNAMTVSLGWAFGAATLSAASLMAWRWVVRPAGGLLALLAQWRAGRTLPREL